MTTNDEDKAEFDLTEAAIAELRKTSAGAAAVAEIEAGAKTFAQAAWTVAKPVGIVLGGVALEALKAFAMSELEGQLNKLSGQK